VARLLERATTKLPVASANRPVPPVMLHVSTMETISPATVAAVSWLTSIRMSNVAVNRPIWVAFPVPVKRTITITVEGGSKSPVPMPRVEDPLKLDDLYENLYTRAQQEGCAPPRQNVSIGINYDGAKVDRLAG
jgi:hypothetical protein